MKTLTIFFSAILLFTSCSSENKDQKENEEPDGIMTYFSGLPTHPFENLSFQSDLAIVEEQLNSLGYKESQEQPFHFNNQVENIEIILQETEKLTSMKIFFFERKKEFYDDLVVFFGEKSSKQSKNDSFVVYEFKTEIHEYSGTIFKMENGIRITFNLKTSH